MDNHKLKFILSFFFALSIHLQPYNLLSQEYKIKLNIKGTTGLKAQFGYYQGDNKYVIQNSTFDKNGKLYFEGSSKLPAGIYLVLIDSIGYFDLLIKDEMEFSVSADKHNLHQTLSVKGSEENRLFFEYQKKVFEKKNKLNEIDSLIAKANDKEKETLNIQKSEINNQLLNVPVDFIKLWPHSYLSKILTAMDIANPDSMDFADPELLRTPFYHNMIRLYIKKNINSNTLYIIAETDKLLEKIKDVDANYQYVLGYLLNFYSSFYKNGINQVFVHIADKYFLPDKATWLGNEALKTLKDRREFLSQGLRGTPAADLVLESTDGEYVSLHQVKSESTLLYFWSVNCGHCTISTKILNDNYKTLSDKRIEIYAVNIDKDKTAWIKKVEELGLLWINCYDPEGTSAYRDKYYVYGSPLLFHISHDKKILEVLNGEKEIEEFVKKTIGN